MVGSVVLSFANVFVRPILFVLTLPATILTLGVFTLVINALILQLVAWLTHGITIRGFMPALKASVVFAVLNYAVGTMMMDEDVAAGVY